MYNVTAMLGTNTFTLNFGTGGVKTVTLIDGYYTLTDLFTAISAGFLT